MGHSNLFLLQDARWLYPNVLVGLVVLALSTLLTIVFYRVALHPLSAFPGPISAAFSSKWLYRICSTTFPEDVLKELHKKYGRVFHTKALRIAPNEIHISDPSIYKIIYSQTAPYEKPDSFYQCFNNPHSLTSETDQSLHRERRRLLNPYFSKKAVGDLSPLVWSKIEKLENKLRIFKGPLDAYDAVRCLTVEVITKFCFGIDVDLIDENQVSFQAGFLDTFDAASHTIVDMVFAPTFNRLKFIIPMPILVRIDKEIANLLRLGEWAQDCLNHWAKGATLADQSSYPIIFDCLEHLPDRTKKAQAVDILAAGSDTTALTLTYGIFHILSNPAVKQRLVDELDAALPDAGTNPSLSELEKLPYLVYNAFLSSRGLLANVFNQTSCMKESLRIASPVPGRLPRIVPKGKAPLIVDGKVIPSGTIVGMSAYSMHRDENIWGQDAYEFKPERWLDGADKKLDQFLCPFSKGQRSCIGQNLAMAEIRLMFAMFFRRFHIYLCPSSTLSKPHDYFTIQLDRPGLLITCSPREK
ncbi:cytochrome P450 monooxygenase [Fusarium phyllophilum]|uniref:Cytochrome P450 monooxygenase n=1 Tax=Fusarium phyllophilum TaxID=47803 RepID=A0A8H5K9C1_9HYPO|nr:cytochrome P450 monooxygenase [Fusarium phyllophilum]